MPECTVHTSRYLPRLVSRFRYEPRVLVVDRKRSGPLAAVTLWKALPRHTNLTVSPLRTVREAGLKKSSRSATRLVAAAAGIAVAARARATVAARRTLLMDPWSRIAPGTTPVPGANASI